jgi:hypothetical protein
MPVRQQPVTIQPAHVRGLRLQGFDGRQSLAADAGTITQPGLLAMVKRGTERSTPMAAAMSSVPVMREAATAAAPLLVSVVGDRAPGCLSTHRRA